MTKRQICPPLLGLLALASVPLAETDTLQEALRRRVLFLRTALSDPSAMGGCSSVTSKDPLLIYSTSDIDLAWLLKVLEAGPQADTGLHERVTGVRVEEVVAMTGSGKEKPDGGGASGSEVKRIVLEYGKNRAPDDPETLIVKLTNCPGLPSYPMAIRVVLFALDIRASYGCRLEDDAYRSFFQQGGSPVIWRASGTPAVVCGTRSSYY